jgi:hypothetical protein
MQMAQGLADKAAMIAGRQLLEELIAISRS